MNYEDFCELATLSILNEVDDRDINLINEFANSSPEFAIELEHLRSAFAILPYGLASLKIQPNLKARLFDRINANEVSHSVSCSTLFASRYNQLDWQPHPVVPRVAIAQLNIDTSTRHLSCMVRCEPDLYYPSHRHASGEEILLLEGDLIVNGEVYGKGDYIYSAPNSIHSPETKTGCVFFVRTSLDDQFTD